MTDPPIDMSQWLRDRLRGRPDPEPDNDNDDDNEAGDMNAQIRRAAGRRPIQTPDGPTAA